MSSIDAVNAARANQGDSPLRWDPFLCSYVRASPTLSGAAAAVVSHHIRTDHHDGNGYTEPREAWIDCSCGAIIWTWQQFYFETDQDAEQNWADHLVWATATEYLDSAMSGWTNANGDICSIITDDKIPAF